MPHRRPLHNGFVISVSAFEIGHLFEDDERVLKEEIYQPNAINFDVFIGYNQKNGKYSHLIKV
jgi:hypothetical protein